MQLGLSAWQGGRGRTGAPVAPTRAASAHSELEGAVNIIDDPAIRDLSQRFPQLEILHLVGQGGMGSVYCARQKSLNRLVALKVIKPDAQDREKFADRFVREARALAQLNHPNIITVHDFGESDGIYYFIMEYVDGINLRQMIQGERLTPQQALEIVPAVCDALQYAHDKGIVHRDIKPENILIDTDGKIKIADFGLAKLLDKESVGPALTQAHEIMGTMHYMAPEQIEKPLTVDHRADIYSLGVVFYELLTGELPLGRFAPPSQKVQIDVRLDEIVLHTLEKEPALRYQRVSEIKSDMESMAANSSAKHPGSPAPAGYAPQIANDARQQYAQATPPNYSPTYSPNYSPDNYVNTLAPPIKQAPQPPVKSYAYQAPRPQLSGTIPRNGFVGVAFAGQTYRNMLYLLLSLPLGIIYFVSIVVGLSVGLGTLIIWIGIFVLLGTFLLVRGYMMLEHGLTVSLLNTSIHRAPPIHDNRQLGVLDRAKHLAFTGRTWWGILYLLVRFPLGILSFVSLVVSMSVPLALISTVIIYRFPWANISVGPWAVDNGPAAAAMAVLGLCLILPAFHVVNGVAWLNAQWAKLCLSLR